MPTVSSPDVALLVEAAAAGDEAAWRQLVARYVRLVWAVVREFRLGDETSEDVVQTTWLRLAENLDRLRRPESIGSWLATTARREAIAMSRRRDREPVINVTDAQVAPDDVELDLGLITDERCAEVVAAFWKMRRECRELLRLRLAEPVLSYREISELLGMPIGSIGPTKDRCIDKLRALVGAQGDG